MEDLPHWMLMSAQSTEFPSNLRRDATRGFIRAQRRACSSWVRERFPGAFSSESNATELPSIQLLTTEVDPPLDPSTDQYEAFQMVGFTHSTMAWRADAWPAVRMAVPDTFRDEGNRALTFGCRRRDAIDPKHRSGRPDPESDWSIAQFADDYLQGLVMRWAFRQPSSRT